MRVLIVEDEALLAMSYKMSLDGGECDVVGIAPNAEAANKMAGSLRPDVVLMDIKLEGDMDGIESARFIMEHYNIPVIFITGNTDEETRQRALKLNPSGYLAKPIDCEKLHKSLCIENTLPRSTQK